MFCSGGINKEDPFNPKDNKENGMMAFFRDVIGNWLNKPYAKAIVLTCFLGYLCVASWGVTQLQEGLEKKRLSRFDSYSVDFYDVEDRYFREYPFRINVSQKDCIIAVPQKLSVTQKPFVLTIDHFLAEKLII